jgi:DNA-binding XRE family transcriptional regulator
VFPFHPLARSRDRARLLFQLRGGLSNIRQSPRRDAALVPRPPSDARQCAGDRSHQQRPRRGGSGRHRGAQFRSLHVSGRVVATGPRSATLGRGRRFSAGAAGGRGLAHRPGRSRSCSWQPVAQRWRNGAFDVLHKSFERLFEEYPSEPVTLSLVADICGVDIEKSDRRTQAELVRRRISLGITQIEAAKGLGCSRTTIAVYENGKSKIPRYIALACAAIIAGLRPLE